MAPPASALFVLAAYLVGTFPTAVLVARAKGRDVTREGSGNPGATNVYRVAGRRAAVAVFAGDAAKGALVTVAGLAWGDRRLALAAGAAAVVGHCFPVTRRFRGGKGVATAAGFLAAIEPVVVAACVAVWLAVLKVTGKASLASLVVTAGALVAVAVTRGPGWDVAALGGVAALVVARHAGNIARLARGEEAPLRGREQP